MAVNLAQAIDYAKFQRIKGRFAFIHLFMKLIIFPYVEYNIFEDEKEATQDPKEIRMSTDIIEFERDDQLEVRNKLEGQKTEIPKDLNKSRRESKISKHSRRSTVFG